MHSTDSAQKPRAPGSAARRLSLPSLPTTCERRATSSAIVALCSTRSLKTSATLPNVPSPVIGNRTVASPRRSALRAASINSISLPCGSEAEGCANAVLMAKGPRGSNGQFWRAHWVRKTDLPSPKNTQAIGNVATVRQRTGDTALSKIWKIHASRGGHIANFGIRPNPCRGTGPPAAHRRGNLR